MARPTKYTDKLGKDLCKRIASGEAIKKICKDDKFPSATTIFNWLLDEEKKEFLDQYKKAMNTKAENMFEDLLAIADEKTKDVQRARLRVDTRKWYLSKVLPKKFGDKIDHTTLGDKLPTPLLHVLHNNSNIENKEPERED